MNTKTAYRTHTCGELRLSDVGKRVVLVGWARRVRTLGGVVFVDLWDRYGITQVIFNQQWDKDLYEQAKKIDREFVIQVEGEVRERENKNPNIPTGEIEIKASKLTILNISKLPPFTLEEHTDGGEELRAKYRYLDLRRPPMQRNLIFRHKLLQFTRNWLSKEGFLELETPFLIKSTPEGARDFVVPSRLYPGHFFALPQSPQLFKQLFMISGYDKYFQIVRCFRDEDLRADRQPEFTQIDCEMSFVDENDVLNTFERFVTDAFKELLNYDLEPFIRMPYEEAMNKYGSDKPDVRFGMLITDITKDVQGHGFKVFDNSEYVGALPVPGGATLSRKKWDQWEEYIKQVADVPGFFYVTWKEELKAKGPIIKILGEETTRELLIKSKAQQGDAIIIMAGPWEKTVSALGTLRMNIAKELNIIPKDTFKALFVVDFPLFSWNEEENRWEPNHHPFTSPKDTDIHLLDTDPGQVKAKAYDLVINGVEVAGGSIRIHDQKIQQKIFDLLGLSREEAQQKFGFFLEALQYGTPPHGGIAFGFDRLTAIMLGEETIRSVIAFPKNKSGRDPMLDAPAPISPEQLKELHLKIVESDRE